MVMKSPLLSFRGGGSGEPAQPNLSPLNLLAKSRDLTQWSQTSGPVVTYDQVGLEGEANTASIVTDNNGSGYAAVNFSCPGFGASQPMMARFFVKETTENDYGWISVYGVGSNFFNFRPNDPYMTGGFTAREDYGQDAYMYVIPSPHYAGWAEIGIWRANGNGSGQISPARGTSYNSNLPSATGSWIVGNVEVYAGLYPWAVIGQPAAFND